MWTEGQGPKLGFLAGFGGLPRWIPFLDALAQRAHRHRAVAARVSRAASAATAVLDSHLDWVLAAHELIREGRARRRRSRRQLGRRLARRRDRGDLAGDRCRRLALIAPFGLFDENDPTTDPWAQRAPDVPGLICADPANWEALKAEPEGQNSPEWPIEQVRASEAAARIFWPLGNTKLEKRLQLITAPTLLLWGARGPIMPRSYADKFAHGIDGKTEIRVIPGAGHLAELDKPDEVAAAILGVDAQ